MFRRIASTGRPTARKSRVVRPGVEALGRRDLPTAGLAAVAYYPATGQLVINGSSNDDRVTVTRNVFRGGIIEVRQLAAVDNRNYRYGPWEQDIVGPVTKIIFNGKDGNDSFTNETSIESLAVGGAGNDTLVGGSGDNVLVGGSGDDRLEAGNGVNRLYGGDGSDTLVGGSGASYLAGVGQDAAVVESSPGNFTLQYSRVASGFGYDRLTGVPGHTAFIVDGCEGYSIDIIGGSGDGGVSPRFGNPVVTPYTPPKQQPGSETPLPGWGTLFGQDRIG